MGEKTDSKCCFAGVCVKCKKENNEPFVWIEESEDELDQMMKNHFKAIHNKSQDEFLQLSPFSDYKKRLIEEDDYDICVRYYHNSSVQLYNYLLEYFEFGYNCDEATGRKRSTAEKRQAAIAERARKRLEEGFSLGTKGYKSRAELHER